MLMQRLICVGSLIAALGLVGCGPSKYGKQMRQEANERLSLVNADIAYSQARRSFEVGQFDRALQEVDEAITRAPSQARYFLLRGRILIEAHKLEAALQCLEMAMELDPNLPQPHYFAGIIFERWSDDREAFERYLRAMELDEANGQFLLATAEALIALGRFAEARDLVHSRMDYFEHNAALHHILAQIAHLEGNPVEAAELFMDARMLMPDDMLILEELVWAQFEAEMYDECLASIEELQSLQQDPRNDLVHLRARCLTLLGRNTEARDIYEQLTQERPTDPEVWFALGLVSREMGDWRRVAVSSVRVIALAPDRYEGYLLKGMNELHHGNLKQAISLFQRSSDLSETAMLPHIMLGKSLEQVGDAQGALAAYNRAEQIEPGSLITGYLIQQLTGVADASNAYPTDDH
jgi:tetratricopeptide (TPR) repeat protein